MSFFGQFDADQVLKLTLNRANIIAASI